MESDIGFGSSSFRSERFVSHRRCKENLSDVLALDRSHPRTVDDTHTAYEIAQTRAMVLASAILRVPRPQVVQARHQQGRVFACRAAGQRITEDRRAVLGIGLLSGLGLVASAAPGPALAVVPGVSRTVDDDFIDTASGLRYLDIKVGSGKKPGPGSRCEIHWSGYTEGYQGKRFGNSTVTDEPFEFTIGRQEAIPAIEEAVQGMMVGGIRRVQIPGDHPELSYPRDKYERFDGSKYRLGPQPLDLGGQRALDFVLDNPTLNDLNRTLLIDVKLLSVN